VVVPGAGDEELAVDLGDLRLFAVVAEELHSGRAAARLHLSQPGLSLTLPGILGLAWSAAGGSPGLQPRDLVLIKVVLGCSRLAGWGALPRAAAVR
jgi:hypothetical protein